jgi:hypothetical protein
MVKSQVLEGYLQSPSKKTQISGPMTDNELIIQQKHFEGIIERVQ